MNIKKIDKNLYNKLTNNRYYIDNKLIPYNNKYIPYMCGTFLEKEDVNIFRSLPFDDSIYDHLNRIIFKNTKNRDFIKSNVMRYLNLKKYRDNNLFIRKMKEIFPSVDGIIKTINSIDESCGSLSILLQRFESFLLLEVGAKQLIKNLPNLNFFTVHDSIAVEESYAMEVRDILSNKIFEITGKNIGLQIKSPKDPFEKIGETVSAIWSKSYKKVVLERRRRLNDITISTC